MRVLLAAFAIAGLAACGKGDASSQEHRTEAPEVEAPGADLEGPTTRLHHSPLTGGTPSPEVELPRRLDFEVLEVGAAPRARRRYALAPGDPVSFTVASRVSMRELAGGAWSDEIALPEVRYGLALHNQDAGDGIVVHVRGLAPEIGDGDSELELAGRELAEQTVARFRHDVARKRATVTATPRGFIDAVELAPPPAPGARSITTEALYQLLLQSVVPFPDAAIGAGGTWRTTMLFRRGAGVVKQTATYELLGVDGDRLRVAVHVEQIGEHQMVSAPGLPPGTTSELVALFFELEGEVTIEPGVLTPVAGTLSVELRVHGRLVTERGTQDSFNESIGEVELTTK